MSLGDLVIRMTADMAEFRNDMGKAVATVENTATQINSTFDRMGNKVESSLKRAALGAVAGLSAASIVNFVRDSIDSLAKLEAAAKKTGTTVEFLSSIKGVAKLAGTSIDELSGSIQKFAVALGEARLMGGEKEKMFKAMGIDPATSKDVGESLVTVAKRLADMKDKAEALKVARDLFGKGVSMEFLDELARAGTLMAKVTTEQARLADQVEKDLIRLKGASGQMGVAVAGAVLPTLNEVLTFSLEIKKEWGLIAAIILGIGGGSILKLLGQDLDPLARAAKDAATAFEDLAKAKKKVAEADAALKLKDNDYIPGLRDLRQSRKDSAEADVTAAEKRLADATRAQQKLSAAAAATRADASKNFDFKLPDLRTYIDQADELADLLNKIRSKGAGVDPAYAKDVSMLTEAFARGRIGAGEYAHAMAMLTDEQKANTAAAKAAADAAKAIDDALEASRKDEERRLSTLEEAATAAEKEVENYGKSKAAIEAETISRLDNLRTMLKQSGATDDVIADIDREIEARRRLAGALASKDALDAAKKAQDEQKQQWGKFVDQIEQSLTDALMRGFENGKSFGQNFVDALKNTLKTTVLKVAVQAAISPITGALRGGGGGAFSGTMSTLSGLNGASSAYQMWSNGFSSMGMSPAVWQGINTGAYSLAGMGTTVAGGTSSQAAMLAAQDSVFGSAGTAATLEAAATVEGASATAASAMSSLAAAAPYIAAFIAVASLLASEGGGPKTEGGAIRTINSAGGLSSFSTGDYYSDGRRDNLGYSANSAMSDMVGSTLTDIQTLVKSLGGDGGGISIGLKFNTDPAGSAPDMVAGDVYNASGQAVFHHDNNSVGRGDYQKELATETLRVTLAAVREANVGGVIGEFLANSISTTAGDAINRLSKEQLNALVATLKGGYLDDILEVVGPLNTDMATLATQLLNLSPGVAALMALTTAVENMPDVFDAAREASLSTFGIYQTQTEKLLDLTQNFDGSLASAQQIADLTQARYQTEIQLIQQITDLLSSLHDSYLSAMDQVNLDTMTSAQQYEFYSNRAQQDLDILRTLTDPALIQQYSQRFMQDVMAGWNLLDPAQKQTNRGSFETLLQTGDTVTADRLNAVQAQIRTDNQAQATALHDAVIDAITSAFTPVTNAMTNAANTPVHVDVDVNVHQQAGLETVSLGGG